MMADEADEFLPPTQENIWKVTRQLKKEQNSLYNCISSVLSDAAFVSEVRALYPGLPLLANLRCGLWYTRQADGTCYFKSTDGHNGNWSFSCTRLNWHVCELAAKQGGVIIVDATRKGKRFPDAMTKTIPIWAAVVNRAVARKRAERLAASVDLATTAEPQQTSAGPEGTPAAPADNPLRSGNMGTLIGASSLRAMQQNNMDSAASPPPSSHGVWAAWAAMEGDTVGACCARVGSLSQWLQSPMAAVVKDDDTDLYPALRYLCPFVGSQPASAAVQCLLPSFTGDCAQATEAELPTYQAGSTAARVASCEGGVNSLTTCSADSSSMGLHEEVSFGDISDACEAMGSQGDNCPRLQSLTSDVTHSDLFIIEPVLENEDEGPCCRCGCAQPVSMPQSGCGLAGADVTTVQCLAASDPLPFAAAAVAGSLPASESGADDVVSMAIAPEEVLAATDTTSCPAAVPYSACKDSVDLGAASASHVSCSPEEGWRRCYLFGGVVIDNGGDLRMCGCDYGSWDCATGVTDHYKNVNYVDDHTVGHVRQGCASGKNHQMLVVKANFQEHDKQRQQQQQSTSPLFQRLQILQVDPDLDADGSVGSCSDTCGPAGLSGRTSMRSSSSSLCVSRSSSCSSDQSDGAPKAVPMAGGAYRIPRICSVHPEETSLRSRPCPLPHQACSATATGPQPYSPSKSRRCNPMLSRPVNSGRLISCGASSSSASSCGGSAGGGSGGSSCYASSHGSSSSSSRSSSAGGGCAAAAVNRVGDGGRLGEDSNGDWDVGLHLPLWVSSNERAQIERRLDGWVDALLRVGADVEGLSKVLRKPLRPLWISQSSTIWVDQVAQPDQLPFTPLYLVSASQLHSYLGQAGCVGGTGSDADGDSSDGCRSDAAARRHHKQEQQRREQQPHAWTYVYVPGAGDDEESWAAGLTPAVFWAHYTELLQAGPTGVHEAVRLVLQREAAALAEHGTDSSILAAAATNGLMAASTSAATLYAAPTDQHHLLPAGCRSSGATAVSNTTATTTSGGAPAPGPRGLFFIGSTGIALGDLSAGTAPGCWEHVDAVLSCGIQQHPSIVGEPQWTHGEQLALSPVSAVATGTQRGIVATAATSAAAAVDPTAGLGSGQPGPCHADAVADVQVADIVTAAGVPVCEEQQKCPSAAAEGNGTLVIGAAATAMDGGFTFQPVPPSPSGPSAGDGDGEGRTTATLEVPPAAAQRRQRSHRRHHNHHHYHHGRRHRPAPRYLHLPVQHYKHNRTSLMENLDDALEFLSYHLSRGHRVLIHDTNGLDTCVCIAVALLLACYGPCGSGKANGPAWARLYQSGGCCSGGSGVPGSETVTKDAVRQRLALVSAYYPPSRPTRGMLRQVSNHFMRARGPPGAGASAEEAGGEGGVE